MDDYKIALKILQVCSIAYYSEHDFLDYFDKNITKKRIVRIAKQLQEEGYVDNFRFLGDSTIIYDKDKTFLTIKGMEYIYGKEIQI